MIMGWGIGVERRRRKYQKAIPPLFFFNFLNNLIYTQVLKIAWSFVSMVYLGYLIMLGSSLTSLRPTHCYLGYHMMLVK